MKTTNKSIIRYFLGLLVALLSITAVSAQEDEREQQVRALIESRNFVFRAQSAFPAMGNTVQLTSGYDLVLKGDTLQTHLPYYGRAYSAVYGSHEGGIRVLSTDFTYKVKERKKGGWDITLIPDDARDVRQLNLTVSENGYASLQVTSNNRQPISFRGQIDRVNRK